jgi:hypothetical protein
MKTMKEKIVGVRSIIFSTLGVEGVLELEMGTKTSGKWVNYLGGLHSNVILSQDPQVGSLEIFKIKTFGILEGHNFF